MRAAPQVALWAHQLTPNVLGGLRSTLMLARHLQGIAPIIITNRSGEFASLANAYRVPTVCVPSEITLRGFRALGLPEKGRFWFEVLSLQCRLAARLLRTGVRILQVDHEAWWLAAPLPRLCGYPIVQYMRCEPGRVTPRTWLSLILSTRCVFISDALREMMLGRAPRLMRRALAKKAVTVRNSIDLDGIRDYLRTHRREAVRAKLGLDSASIVVLNVGTLCDRKDQHGLLNDVAPGLFARVPNLRLVFVGDADPPTWLTRCEGVVRAHGWNRRVQFVPFTDAVYDWYRASDIIVHYSKGEGIPRVVVEAQAFGLPVVARSIVGINEALLNGESGYIESGPDAIGQRVIALASDADSRRKMGAAGEKFVAMRFTPEIAAARMETIYAELWRSGRCR